MMAIYEAGAKENNPMVVIFWVIGKFFPHYMLISNPCVDVGFLALFIKGEKGKKGSLI